MTNVRSFSARTKKWGVLLLFTIAVCWYSFYTAYEGRIQTFPYLAFHNEILFIHLQLALLCFFQNVSFVFVSRSRNRTNSYYHFIAAVGSNGIWYLVFAQLVPEHMPLEFLIPFLGGTTLGSLFAAHVARFIEQMLGITADSTKKEKITQHIKRSSWTRWLKKYSLFILFGCIGIGSMIVNASFSAAFYVMLLGYIQNMVFSIASRAGNRDGRIYLFFATIASRLIFFSMLAYLFQKDMSLVLIIPYIMGTVFGSLTGSYISMPIERYFGLSPDSHVADNVVKNTGDVSHTWISRKSSHIFYALLGILTALSLKNIFTSPFASSLILITCFCFAESFCYALTRRASNRDSMNYHLFFRILNGIVWFLLYKQLIVLLTSLPFYEVVMPALLGSTYAAFFAQTLGEKIEKKIGAVMDVPLKPKTV